MYRNRPEHIPDSFNAFIRHGAHLWNFHPSLQILTDPADEMPVSKKIERMAVRRAKEAVRRKEKVERILIDREGKEGGEGEEEEERKEEGTARATKGE